MKRIRVALWSLLALACAGMVMPARAQMAVYGEFTGANPEVANAPHLYGATFGLYLTRRFGPVALGPDLRGVIAGRGSSSPNASQALDMGLGGLRLAVTPRVLPIMPYVEVLGGVGYERTGQGSSRQDQYDAMTQFIGGVDYTIVPRLDWRVVEFTYGRLGGSIGVYNPRTLSTGVVLRLP